MKTQATDLARVQSIHSGRREPLLLAPGLQIREFVSQACGSRGFSTGTATFDPHVVLPYHKHPFSEAITVLSGDACVDVEGRSYHLSSFDCITVPAGAVHQVTNRSEHSQMVALWAFACPEPSRELIEGNWKVDERGKSNPEPDDPECIVRFATSEIYELSPGARFRDLFAARFGSVGICGGYGRFQPGASLPCHIHDFDESITIVEGEAACLVQGTRYTLLGYDTAFVPEGRPHRFINESDSAMAMVWVYAGNEPERAIVDAGYCAGTLVWPEKKLP